MLCFRRVMLKLAKQNIVARCQHQSSVALEMRRILKGELDGLSVSWWCVKARYLLGGDVTVKSRFWFLSRSFEVKFFHLHHARSLLG